MTFVAGSQDFLRGHFDARPLGTMSAKAINCCLESGAILGLRRDQAGNRPAIASDCDRLAVLDSAQQLRQTRLGLGG